MKNFPRGVIIRNLHNIIAYTVMSGLADSLKNLRLTYFASYIDALGMWPKMKPKRAAIRSGAKIFDRDFELLLVRDWFGAWLHLSRMNKKISGKGL
jgi:hypothetical protein